MRNPDFRDFVCCWPTPISASPFYISRDLGDAYGRNANAAIQSKGTVNTERTEADRSEAYPKKRGVGTSGRNKPNQSSSGETNA
jgi:hypothetical protein